jgi:hypothetical protein
MDYTVGGASKSSNYNYNPLMLGSLSTGILCHLEEPTDLQTLGNTLPTYLRPFLAGGMLVHRVITTAKDS